jgi:2-hydroxychromene-2-carboxylate isomerase
MAAGSSREDATMNAEIKLKVCRLIAGLVVADSDLADEEDVFVDRMLAGFGIPEQRDAIFPIVDRDEAAAEVKLLPPEVQKEALSMLVRAAVADGQVVAEERDYLHAVAAAMGLQAAVVDARLDEALAARSKA